jgi:hypothetical protein
MGEDVRSISGESSTLELPRHTAAFGEDFDGADGRAETARQFAPLNEVTISREGQPVVRLGQRQRGTDRAIELSLIVSIAPGAQNIG